MKTNAIGLPAAESEALIDDLNSLLSSYQVYYQNLRGMHWNIRGKRFFNLHVKFEELYNQAQLHIDEVAERILTIGGTPLHTLADYLDRNTLRIGKNISNDVDAVHLVVESLLGLLKIERVVLDKSAIIYDEGTNSMMSDLIKEQEKTIWMMKAWLEESL
jgi:starvation-inducible DNA-binding protein